MSSFFNRIFSGRQAATVPSMDGVLRPNDKLDKADVLVSAKEPDNLICLKSSILFSSGNDILRFSTSKESSKAKVLHHMDAPVTALASSSKEALAIGLDGSGIRIIGGEHDGLVLDMLGSQSAKCPTAMSFQDEDVLFICLGSARNSALDWQRDLMETHPSGSLWRVDLKTNAATCIADGLAFPNGILIRGGSIVVTESWNHRLLSFDINGKNRLQKIVLEDIPGYPSRLTPASNGGAWLAVFAPRSQLIEFVLRENAYRTRMLRELPKELWIAPTLRSGNSFLEPMQGGAVKVHGIFKPWAPTRSYGLVILLDANLEPVSSFHSRADGSRHGMVSICEQGENVIFASRGNDLLCSLPIPQDDKGRKTQ